jgi:hypothetical protein
MLMKREERDHWKGEFIYSIITCRCISHMPLHLSHAHMCYLAMNATELSRLES